MPAPAAAVDQQDIWKDDQMRAFAVALVTHALQQLNVGSLHFTTDCVPDAERVAGGIHIGPGVPGSVLTKLQNANIARPVGVFQNGVFYQHRVKSGRDEAKTRYVNVYELASRAAAEEFLRRNKITGVGPQMILIPEPTAAAL